MNKNNTISKEYLLAEIDDLADEFSELDENGLHSERWCGIMDAKQIIINTPFVLDKPQGEWIDKGKNLWKCSNCEMVIYSESEQDRNEFHKWCSRCGARMKGADNETEMS